MNTEQEITLSNGVVIRAIQVPPMLMWDAQFNIPALADVGEPVAEIKTKTGTETVKLNPGENGYDEWQARHDAVELEQRKFQRWFLWEAGVMSWKLPETDTFQSQPPEDYAVPDIWIKAAGFSQYLDSRRLAYIKYVLCSDPTDFAEISKVLYGSQPLTTEEVDATVSKFPDTV